LQEGISLATDVYMKNTLDEINVGVDRQLEWAVKELR